MDVQEHGIEAVPRQTGGLGWPLEHS
jgi:hypothetical protein